MSDEQKPPGPNDPTQANPILPPDSGDTPDGQPVIPQPSNKTVPIRLDADDYGFFNFKKGKKPGTPPPDSKKEEPEDPNKPWMGNEQTVVGFTPDLSAPPAGKKPDFQWIGNEQTLVGVPTDKSKHSGETTKTNRPWIGNEQTMVGMPTDASGSKPPTDKGEAWLGNEATLVGTPVPGGVIQSDKPTDPNKLRKTTATMDDGWHLKGRQGPLTGQNMGDYEVGGILGEGGMGTVYRARQISLKRRVALKVLPPNLASDARLRERFEMEARTASLLNSPHVVQVFAAGNANDNVFFVMEYVEGTDLSAIINEKKDAKVQFTAEEATGYIIQAARGLAEAGKHGIVHRDIKPPNLMVTTKGLVKIADFGISKLAGEHSLTMTGTAVGTPAYVSPEQGRGDAVDPRSDLYSLGIVYYELLTGQKPFDGSTANALIYQHNYAEPKLPRDLNPEIPEGYQAVVLKLMQKDPVNRYQDANELVGDLERIRVGNAPMTALLGAFGTGADEAMKRLGIKKQRLAPLIAAAMIMILGGGGGFWYWLSNSEERNRQESVVKGFRNNLKALDIAQAINPSSKDDLERLEKTVGAKDADVIRWKAKLERVDKLTESLSRLDSASLPDFEVRSAAKLDIEKYKTEVGTSEDVKRWNDRIAETEKNIETLRGSLQEMNDVKQMTSLLYDRYQPNVVILAKLAGAEDIDAKRWSAQLEDYNTRLTTLTERLTTTLKDPSKVKVNDQTALDGDLETIKVMLGENNAEVRNWKVQLQIAKDNLKRLTDSLKRYDTATTVNKALVAELAPDLEAYAQLVDDNEPQLINWKRKGTDLDKSIAALAKKLSPLDDPKPISPDEKDLFTDNLESYKGLVGRDDAKFQAWKARMDSDDRAIEGLKNTLKRLDADQTNPLTIAELDACDKALKDADARGAVNTRESAVYSRRLTSERAEFDRKKQRLIDRKKDKDTRITLELKQEIDEYTKLAGSQDAEALFWSKKSQDFDRLFKVLSTLDKPLPIPENALKQIDDFAVIVGQDEEKVKVWRDKVIEVEALKKDLAGLSRVEAMPEAAADKVDKLIADVGPEELDAKKWKIKVDRVTELKKNLDRELYLYVRVPTSAPQLQELTALVGKVDKDVARYDIRQALLDGPPQPDWAFAFGRDEDYGIYADLVVEHGSKKITQRFRYCPASTFTMGSPKKDGDKDEAPVEMTLSKSFWIADTECKNSLWSALVGSVPSRYDQDEFPVERVSRGEAGDFVDAINKKFRTLKANLPTEVQWECACRAGTAGSFIGNGKEVTDAKDIDTLMWSVRNSGATAKGVGRRFPNTIGLFDMHGNVWEWCRDHYGVYPPVGAIDYEGKQEDTYVARGGSWGDKVDKCRAANRLEVDGSMRTVYLGFRIVAEVAWPEGQEPGAKNPATAKVDP